MANKTIGTVICPMLGDLAEVREDKNGKLYYAGMAGLISPKTASGQQWIRKHMVRDELNESAPVTDDVLDTQLDEHEPTVRAKSLLDAIWGGDDE